MYLSKADILIRSYVGRNSLLDYQLLHQKIQDIYQCSRQEGQVLYRVHIQQAIVYIKSNRPPKKENNDALHITMFRDITTLEKKFVEGKNYRFDLLTEPYKKVSKEGQKNSQRRHLKLLEERISWHHRKAEQNGYKILQMTEYPANSIQGSHRKNNGGNFRYCPTRVSGTLEIVDCQKFTKAWINGIGSGKSYGMGFLLLQ